MVNECSQAYKTERDLKTEVYNLQKQINYVES